MAQQKGNLRMAADPLIAATNTTDVEAMLMLCTPDAVINDPLTGRSFDGHARIRDDIEWTAQKAGPQ